MKADPRIFINYLHVNCVRNLAIHRGLIDKAKSDSANTWRLLANSSIDMAVIEWCNLFGSNGINNSTHWHNSAYRWIKDRHEFIREILSPAGITFKDWKIYHSALVTYRNKNVAHLDVDDWHRDVPTLDLALKVLVLSYQIFEKHSHQARSLQDEYDRTLKEIEGLVRA